MSWKPDIDLAHAPHGLYPLWAMALTVALKRPVEPREVVSAVRHPGWPDTGLEPAVARWKAVPVRHRFCPPGIKAPCTEADVRMWLKVGATLERLSG